MNVLLTEIPGATWSVLTPEFIQQVASIHHLVLVYILHVYNPKGFCFLNHQHLDNRSRANPTAVLHVCQSDTSLQHPISQLQYLVETHVKTAYRLMYRGPWYVFKHTGQFIRCMLIQTLLVESWGSCTEPDKTSNHFTSWKVSKHGVRCINAHRYCIAMWTSPLNTGYCLIFALIKVATGGYNIKRRCKYSHNFPAYRHAYSCPCSIIYRQGYFFLTVMPHVGYRTFRFIQ